MKSSTAVHLLSQIWCKIALFSSKPIKMVLSDVNGVMTDCTIYMSKSKAFNIKDELTIELLRVHAIKLGVISGKASIALINRWQQLGFDVNDTGSKHKLSKLSETCTRLNISADELAFCCDDVLNLPIIMSCGFSAVPVDAHQLVLTEAYWVSKYKGGFGMVEDFVDQSLVSQNGLELKEVYQPLL